MAPSWLHAVSAAEHGVVPIHVVFQEAFSSSAERRNYLLNHGLPKSGRPVTPNSFAAAFYNMFFEIVVEPHHMRIGVIDVFI